MIPQLTGLRAPYKTDYQPTKEAGRHKTHNVLINVLDYDSGFAERVYLCVIWSQI